MAVYMLSVKAFASSAGTADQQLNNQQRRKNNEIYVRTYEY